MPEKLNDYSGQAPNDDGAEATKTPPDFDPEAARNAKIARAEELYIARKGEIAKKNPDWNSVGINIEESKRLMDELGIKDVPPEERQNDNYGKKEPELRRAWFMADVENGSRTAAIESRKEASALREIANGLYKSMMEATEAGNSKLAEKIKEALDTANEELEKANDRASASDELAGFAGEDAGTFYDLLHQQAPNDDDAEVKEAHQKAIAEYETSHPDAVKDTDKAWEMAEAGNSDRSFAADIRTRMYMLDEKIKEAWDNYEKQKTIKNYDEWQKLKQDKEDLLNYVRRLDQQAEAKEKAAGEKYDG